MLAIPLLSEYIEKVLAKQLLADSIDTLNYYVTSIILGIFALLISCKQYFGAPIQCWVPNEFKGGWEKYAEDYCFVASAYHVPFESKHIPMEHRGDHVSYYRWVPMVLALQAVFFFLPNYLWGVMANNCVVNPRQFVEEANKVKTMNGPEREKGVDGLVEQFMGGVAVFGDGYSGRRFLARSGWNCTYLYLFTKAMYVMNLLGQMFILNSFLGGTYWKWGANTVGDIVSGREWQEAEVFPRVILCDFRVRVLAQMHTYTVQCVIMMNMINEKLYLFIYIWFLFLMALTIGNFFYYLVTLAIPSLRARLILWNIDRKRVRMSRRDTDRFIFDCLHPDGVLLLLFIREHVGGRVAAELTHKLIQHYANGSVSSRSSEGEHSNMDSLEKKPFISTMPINHFDRYDPPPKAHQLAAPKYPHLSPNRTMESAPPVDEFDRYTTMRMDDRSMLPRPSPRTAPGMDQPDNSMVRNSTPTDV
ncbi:hypothetical protein PFISCL1PPCAC_23845 [Pristionchus fissidentatus]|uniref:Innexin n=1 Tax=Pristionchus fissidentatus TaxID=1538716 RepID=A0AAV5WQL4_9BILA|nr:hypothetical protein PFISCL1PPCAC_23845 [Pristionchus fissidentatus]